MRVLLVSPASELGGAERCLLDCVAALSQAVPSVDVDVLAFADGPLLAQARKLGATTHVVELPSELAEVGESGAGETAYFQVARFASSTARFLVHLRRAVRAARPDVVHTNGMKAHLLAGAIAPASSRLVVHLHDFIAARRASRLLMPALARLRPGAVFMANSQAVAADFSRIAPGATVRTVYNVVDTDYFQPGARDAEWLASCAEIGPPSADTVCFGLVATYAHWKGHRLFLEAAGKLREAHPRARVRFYVVGGAIYATRGSQVHPDDLRSWARHAGIEGSFGLVPFQSDIARVYRALNVVVHASTQPEPFGRTIVEAMSCGISVLVANAGGAAELFQHGENAVGYEQGSSGALAAAMAQVLDVNARQALSVGARAHALAQFSRKRLTGELLAVYGCRVRVPSRET
jgi:glycosyltransferase involved in cell wall biosynthesis